MRVSLKNMALMLFIIALSVSTLWWNAGMKRAEASASTPNRNNVTRSHVEGLENYDIRLDDRLEARKTLTLLGNYTNSETKVKARAAIVAGEAKLRNRLPNLRVEVSSDLRQPEVIGTDARQGGFLTEQLANVGPGLPNSAAVRSFVKQNCRLFGLTDKQTDALTVEADYTNPDGNLSYVILSQSFNGWPVFRGEVSAMITQRGEIARLINNLAPGLDESKLARDWMSAEDAVAAAAGFVNRAAQRDELKVTSLKHNGAVVEFERGPFDWPITAEKMYFPTEMGVATPAWRVLLWEQVAAYYVIVDAQSGALLWRKNITEDQTQPATYNIYQDDSPAPLSPGITDPNTGTQAPLIQRTTITLVGNEAQNTFNNNGWLTNGSTDTDGNNIEAGLDRDGTNGVDPNGKATSATRQFVFAYNPPPGNPAPGAEPTPASGAPMSDYQKGSVTQLFYLSNLFHDRLYRVGFTEQARNFQQDNFARGGIGNDRISGEAQDTAANNNGFFTTPADGARGRMQMGLFLNPTPDRDSSLDADFVWHELTHGLSNRLIGNGTGLNTPQARGMGEGWSDFYARLLAAGPDEDVAANYSWSGYVTYLVWNTNFTGNYYSGGRWFPYALMSSLGPNGRPHNPVTFADISINANVTDGAYSPAIPWQAGDEHARGQVWCSALLEVRARLINRLGFALGNQRILQLNTDALKTSPLNPTFIQARDAIIAADQASFGGTNLDDIWSGFATRGMGFGAAINGAGVVTESFQAPILFQEPAFTISDISGNNNGVPDPNENVTLTVPLFNPLNAPATNVTVSINGSAAVSYGNIPGMQTATQNIIYTVPSGETCGGFFTFNIAVNCNRGSVNLSRRVQLGLPVVSRTLDFDNLAVPSLPAGWTSTIITGGATMNWVSTTANPDSGTKSLFTNNPATFGLVELTSDEFANVSPNALVTFRNQYETEAGDDGGALEISINGGPFQDIIAAGGQFLSGGYNSTLSGGSALAIRNAWSGNSGGYITTAVILPVAANGQNVKFKWRFGTDDSTGGAGWNIDTLKFFNSYNCSAAPSGTLQFSGATFSANEGTPTATITVTRIGAAAGTTARVNYSTADGTATQRTDYIITNGMLDFMAGETSKTFTISLIDDVYIEGNETLNLNLSNPSGAAAGGQVTALLTIQDNDTATPTANPSDGAQFFVRQQYLEFLAREPDAAGTTYWTGQITACGADVACQRSRRRDVSAAFFVESEFQESGGYVYRLHKAAFGQLPTFADFMPDRARVVGGTTLEAGKELFANEFARRTTFTNRYPATQTGTQFIDALLATVLQGSAVNLSGLRPTLLNDFNANGSRARVLRLVADSAELRAAEYNRGFVLMQYYGYLRREIDQAGYDFWFNALGPLGGNFEGMVCSFITSQEYQQRFSPVFTHTNSECQ